MTNVERRLVRGQPISVVVPVRNFGYGIQQFLDMWRKPIEVASNNIREIIVVDDASTDSTPSVVESYTVRHPEVTLIRQEVRRGFGPTLQAGINSSRHPLVLILCPDWSYQPGDLGPMVEAMLGADVVAPVRPGAERPMWVQRAGSTGRFLARWALGVEFGSPVAWYGWRHQLRRLRLRMRFGLRLQDPTCGMRLIRKAILDRCPIQSDGSFALVEMYAKSNFVGALFHEVQLNRAGTVPALNEPPETKIGDQKQVFRSPTFCSVS